MNRFSRTEFQLIEYLYKRENGANEGHSILEAELSLQEKDEISRIRELVFYVEKLEREGVMETDSGFYTESDHMSFTYLNSAVELDEDRIRLSDEGRRLMTEHLGSVRTGRFSNAYVAIMKEPEAKRALEIVSGGALLLGLALGYIAGRLF